MLIFRPTGEGALVERRRLSDAPVRALSWHKPERLAALVGSSIKEVFGNKQTTQVPESIEGEIGHAFSGDGAYLAWRCAFNAISIYHRVGS